MFVKLRRFSLAVTGWRTIRRYSSGNCAEALAPASAKFRILGVHSGHEAGDLWQRGRPDQQTASDQQEGVLVDIRGTGVSLQRRPGPGPFPFAYPPRLPF